MYNNNNIDLEARSWDYTKLDELQANLTRTGRSGYRRYGLRSWLSTTGTCGECVSDCCEFHSDLFFFSLDCQGTDPGHVSLQGQ